MPETRVVADQGQCLNGACLPTASSLGRYHPPCHTPPPVSCATTDWIPRARAAHARGETRHIVWLSTQCSDCLCCELATAWPVPTCPLLLWLWQRGGLNWVSLKCSIIQSTGTVLLYTYSAASFGEPCKSNCCAYRQAARSAEESCHLRTRTSVRSASVGRLLATADQSCITRNVRARYRMRGVGCV